MSVEVMKGEKTLSSELKRESEGEDLENRKVGMYM